MSNSENVQSAISCLQHSIEDAQETIRGYDTKAEILGVLLTLAIGFTNFTYFQHVSGCTKYLLISAWIVTLLAILLLGFVLRPKKNLFKKIEMGEYQPSETYFLSNIGSSPQHTVSLISEKALNTDWVAELVYESMKLSLIRDYKHRCFIFSLWLSGAALLLIALLVIVQGLK